MQGRLCKPFLGLLPASINLTACRSGTSVKYRKNYCFTNVSGVVDYDVYINNFDATYRAIVERVFLVKHNGIHMPVNRPLPGVFNMLMSDFSRLLDAYATFSTPLNAADFADRFQGRRRVAYINAAEKNLTYGFNDRLARIQAFMKCEKYNFTAKEDPVPRIIQPRNVRYIVETGRYVKTIEKRIYKSINKIFDDTVVYKGLNMEQRGRSIHNTWSKYRKPVAIGLDASRFDQHVSLSAIDWEHQRYFKYFPGDKHFQHLMSLQRINKGYTRLRDGWIKYTVVGNRMSGDSNTSLGNVVIMCGMVWSFLHTYGITASLVNDGDDCVLVGEAGIVDKVQEHIESYFGQLGFTLTIEKPVYVLEKIVFCQSQPVFDGKQYLMVRDPRVAISKDALSLKPLLTRNVFRKWCSAVGKGGLTLTTNIPVWQDFYDIFVRLSEGASALKDPTLESGFFRLGIGMKRVRNTITPECRCSFWKAFDISPEEQVVIEDYYRGYIMSNEDTLNRFQLLPLHC